MKILFFILATCSISAMAQIISKKEYVVNDVTYIEETSKDKTGLTSTVRYAKPGQGKQTTTVTKDSLKNTTTTTKIEEPGLKAQISITQTPAETKQTEKLATDLNNSLIECKLFEGAMPHPLIPKETIKVKVWGKIDQKCKMTQTMPNNGLVTCLLTDEHRKKIKANPKTALLSLFPDESICKITGY